MNNYFSKYNWTGLTILKAEKIHTDDIGNLSVVKGQTSFYQIGIKLSGKTQILYNGIDYDYSSGHIVYLPKESDPNAVYKRKIVLEGDSAFVFFDSIYDLPKTPFSIPCDVNSSIARQFTKVAFLYSQGKHLSCMQNFYELILMLSKACEKKYKCTSAFDRLLPAEEYIKAHICDSYIDIGHLSKLCNMTVGYFQHQFKNVYEAPPLKYVNNQKCFYAENLLKQTNYSVNQVASSVGINDVNYFCRFFKQHTGLSPLEYRKIYNRQL